MKLEVGMIARTNKGLLIDIIHDFDSELCAYKRDEITKASFNLIDLIEVGDYVNGYKIREHSIQNGIFNYYDEKGNYYRIENNKDIKEVLTKEQYNANAYIV